MKVIFKNQIMNVVLDKLLAAIVGGLCAFIVVAVFVNKSPNLCSVNVNLIVDDFIKTMAKSNIPANALEKSTHDYMRQLQVEITKLSKEREAILLLSEAVVAGASDVTEIIKSRTDKHYKQVTNTDVEQANTGIKDDKQ